MMHLFLILAMLWAAPFWETKPPEQWTAEQLLEMFTDSPWAQTTQFPEAVSISVYLSTARPMRQAEEESIRRFTSKQPGGQAPDLGARNEYLAFLEESPGKSIVLAILNPNTQALAEAAETKEMEKQSRLKAGGKTYKLTGYFPPAGADPVLRLVFPRPAGPVKELNFEVYVPGTSAPYRQALFRVKDLNYRGQSEF